MKLAYSSLLIIILSCFFVSVQSQKCQDMIKDWFKDIQKFSPVTYVDSGKFINDLGDYNNCLDNDNGYFYVTLRVLNLLLMNYQYMGICPPLQCREEILGQKKVENQKAIGKMLNEAYQNITQDTQSPFILVQLFDPVQNLPQVDWSNYLTFALIGFLVMMGIIGSVMHKITRSDTKLIKAIKCFSFYHNLKKIVKVPAVHQNQNLLFLNGVRVLSIFWIVFGHDMWIRFLNIKNWLKTGDILQTPGVTTLAVAAYFAVDVFFWIGAFLVTTSMIPILKKRPNFIKFYGSCVLHRIIRIWPTYMLAILMYWKVAPILGSGPIWSTYQLRTNSCNDGGFLSNIFFIDNFADHGKSGLDYCFGWGWYLAVDFQLFLITPFILFVYSRSKKWGILLNFLIFLGSIITGITLIFVNDWRYPIPNPNFKPQPDFMDNFYFKPYIRASVYTMGIFTGMLYYEWKNQSLKVCRIIQYINNSILIRVLFYVVGITLVQGTIWIIVPYQTGQSIWSSLDQALYNTFNRVVFVFGMFLCIFAAMFGCKNDPAKFILGHKLFSPLAKISFCIYLVHLIVVMNATYSVRMQLYWQPLSAIYLIIADIFWSVILATFLSLIIESPTLSLEKILLRGQKKKAKQYKDLQGGQSKRLQFKQDLGMGKGMLSDSGSEASSDSGKNNLML